jgi:hypothetical protein
MKALKIILLCIAIFSAFYSKAQQKNSLKNIHVLFIGNSLTYYQDMPQTLQQMLNETDSNVKIEQSTFPGMSLSGHLSDIITSKTKNGINTRKKEAGEKTETEIKIAERQWDIVILQTGTVNVLIPENRELKTNKAISEIQKLISNPNCKFILFNTWPAKNTYPKQYCYPSRLIDPSIQKDKCCSSVLESLEQEVKAINDAYDTVAEINQLIKSDNANKFYNVLVNCPEIELYEDDSHPNKNGAFLNACIFYQMLANKKASQLIYNGEIEPNIATLLKDIAGTN